MVLSLFTFVVSCSEKPKGILEVFSEVSDAEIHVDGKPVGTTTGDELLAFVIKLEEGEHKVRLVKPSDKRKGYGRVSDTKTMIITPDAIQAVKVGGLNAGQVVVDPDLAAKTRDAEGKATRIAMERKNSEEKARMITEEKRRVEEERIAEEKKLLEEKRLAEEERLKEEKRLEEEKQIAEGKELFRAKRLEMAEKQRIQISQRVAQKKNEKLFLEQFDKENSYHQALISIAYIKSSHGFAVDIEKGRNWAELSAGKNHPLGCYCLSLIAKTDPKLSSKRQREVESNRFRKKANSAGFMNPPLGEHAEWFSLLGDCYEWGYGVPKDIKKAAELYQKAANLDESMGLQSLGSLYQRGKGLEKNEKKSFDFFKRSADMGNAEAMNSLGLCYDIGIGGISENQAKAQKYYQQSADLGYIVGLVNLANRYKKGKGVVKDFEKMNELYWRALDLGQPWGFSQLAESYENGRGVEKHIGISAELLRGFKRFM